MGAGDHIDYGWDAPKVKRHLSPQVPSTSGAHSTRFVSPRPIEAGQTRATSDRKTQRKSSKVKKNSDVPRVKTPSAAILLRSLVWSHSKPGENMRGIYGHMCASQDSAGGDDIRGGRRTPSTKGCCLVCRCASEEMMGETMLTRANESSQKTRRAAHARATTASGFAGGREQSETGR